MMKNVTWILIGFLLIHQSAIALSNNASFTISLMLNRPMIMNHNVIARNNNFQLHSVYGYAVSFDYTKFPKYNSNVFYKVGLRYWENPLQMDIYSFENEFTINYLQIAVPIHIGKRFYYNDDNALDVYAGVSLGVKQLDTEAIVNTNNSMLFDKSITKFQFSTGLDIGLRWFAFRRFPQWSIQALSTFKLYPSSRIKGALTMNKGSSIEKTSTINTAMTISNIKLGIGYAFSFKKSQNAIRNQTIVPFLK